MKLVVGLGNPEKKYDNTRHNIGFWVLEKFLSNEKWQKKFQGLYCQKVINSQTVIFLKPLTYMNLSGLAVKEYVNYFNIALDDILIIHDDLDLPIGSYRLKKNSSSGGHNGIKSIIKELNSMNFSRLKVGIQNDNIVDTIDFVLGKFSNKEIALLEEIYPTIEKILECFINNGIEKKMNMYNTK